MKRIRIIFIENCQQPKINDYTQGYTFAIHSQRKAHIMVIILAWSTVSRIVTYSRIYEECYESICHCGWNTISQSNHIVASNYITCAQDCNEIVIATDESHFKTH